MRERPEAQTTITMRLPLRARELIDAAAEVEGRSTAEFMVESARLHAIEVLLDQRVFNLDAEESEALAKRLTNPPRPNDALRDLLSAKAPWE